MKYFKLAIYTLFLLVFFAVARPASAVTEFKSTIKPSGGDYSTLATAENGLDHTGACDLTSTSYLTVGYDGAVGDPTLITDGEAVTWDSGASTGNMVHITTASKSGADAFFINVTAGTLDDNDVIDDGDGNTITVAGIPDTAQITIEIDGSWTSSDATAVAINGWTTDATHYIKIYTTSVARHDGKWNILKYRLEIPSNTALTIAEENVRVEGLQIAVTSVAAASVAAVDISAGGTCDVRLSYSILKGITNSSYDYHTGVRLSSSGSGNIKIWNCVVYDFGGGTGVYSRGLNMYGTAVGTHTCYLYNNTIYGIVGTSGMGTRQAGSVTVVAKNSISYNNTNNYDGTFDASSTNNLSGPTQTNAPGSNPRNGVTVTFVDANNDDFHLALNDAGARNWGTSLAGDGSLAFNDDIDGKHRPSEANKWDIGADEYPEAIIQFMRNINFGRNINFKP